MSCCVLKHNRLFRILCINVFIFMIYQISLIAQTSKKFEYKYLKNQLLPRNFVIFEKAYPDLVFEPVFDTEAHEWEIKITTPELKSKTFYWCKGGLLPKEELKNKDKYWSLLYKYNKNLEDPANMTNEQRQALKEYTSAERRREDAGTPMFFFDFLYGSQSRVSIEKNIVVTTFLGKRTKVHKRIEEPLRKVEERINLLAERDESVRNFVENILSTDAYNWRIIAGTNRKSFHSLGIAIDILPEKYRGEMFWSWTKDKDPDGWMLTPLSQRWMPPESVINIFEDEGFIWGGKWAIWDNMHFEYHPELLVK